MPQPLRAQLGAPYFGRAKLKSRQEKLPKTWLDSTIQWQQVVVAREQQLVGESESFHIQLIDVYQLALLDDITLADTFESTYFAHGWYVAMHPRLQVPEVWGQ